MQKFDVQNPPLNLTLNQHVFNERGALSHLGIQVASTDDVLATRLIEAKKSDAAQASVCCGASIPVEVTDESNTSAACCG